MKLFIVLILVIYFVSGGFADVYLHTMRGSNNRLDEANRERNNGNRLFDSQNNNRGGYNVGSQFYYVGEEVRLEWTNQHACSNSKMNCDLILQFMCDELVRDGTTTQTIPNNPAADANPEWGRHESYEFYKKCTTRERNEGLFTASQNLNGNTAKYTRQNPNGQRRGFECPEERDYYPYWHHSPWRDIAIFTDNMDRCESLFQKESQNVRDKGACWNDTVHNGKHHSHEVIDENSPITCELRGFKWKETGAWAMPEPECVPAPWTRENHLGNTIGGETPAWVWKVPDFVHERCVLRMRYNISTGEYDGWNPGLVNHTLNDREGLKLGLTEFFGSAPDVYPFKNNPVVGFGLPGVELELAVNTAQYGRTFQDRSHRFAIRRRPSSLDDDDRIVALTARGKRGNIVQVFPAVEYDFVPNTLEVSTSDYIHMQFTGSNTNPANNDGQGKRQTDRQNMVQIHEMGRTYPAHLHNMTFFNASESSYVPDNAEFTQFAAVNGPNYRGGGQFGGEMSELDDSGTYHDYGLVQISSSGEYYYYNSRNNNFSNRGQSARALVEEGDDSDSLSTGSIVGIVVGVGAAFILIAIAAVFGAIYLRKQRQLAAIQSYSPVAADEPSFSSMYTADD